MNLSRYREASRPELSDEYGTGALRFFALGSTARQDGRAYEVITTSITNQYPSTGYRVSEPFREAHVFYFHHNGAEWRVGGGKRGAAAADPRHLLARLPFQRHDIFDAAHCC